MATLKGYLFILLPCCRVDGSDDIKLSKT